MEKLNKQSYKKTKRPEKVVQFGEGNFLRAFVDWIISRMNQTTDFDGNVVVVKPRPGSTEKFDEQDCLFQVGLRGVADGKVVDTHEVVDVISRVVNPYEDFVSFLKIAENPDLRFVVSNTTEAGIEFDPSCNAYDKPARTFPGKLTQLLLHRFRTFCGAPCKGLIIMPCELIGSNGDELRKCINQYIEHWDLDDEFKEWFDNSCIVCNTLVDRIVSGYPREEIDQINALTGYDDKLYTVGEVFHVWAIEAPKWVSQEFPAEAAGLNVKFVEKEKPYHDMKVALLNAPHTALSAVGRLAGIETVREATEDELVGKYIRKIIFDELIGTVDLPAEEKEGFAASVIERFRNPFVKHKLESIMLNAFPKYKARDLGALKRIAQETGQVPSALALGLAALIVYYRGDKLKPNDSEQIVEFLNNAWQKPSVEETVKEVLAAEWLWGEDLNNIKELNEKITQQVKTILNQGINAAITEIV